MSKILDYLMQDDVDIVFDIDGVLCPFEFGDLKHNGCKDKDWEAFVFENKPYDNAKAIPQIQKFIQKKGTEHVFVCSVAEPLEERNKADFVEREYGIPKQHIWFVRNKKAKIDFLRSLVTPVKQEKKIALVEDTVATLNQVYEQSDFTTVHISSFFFYQ